jgi:ABC-2 type transport system permease protein
VGAELAYLPAVWVLVGLAVLLYGFVPKAAAVAWAAYALMLLAGLLGDLLNLPGWVVQVSPFTHVPDLPAGDFHLLPLVVLTVVAVALTVAGLAGFRRRDTPA